MAFSPNEFLVDTIEYPNEHVRCRQHAARTFVDEQFRLLPKTKFLYHVAFNINWPAVDKTKVGAKLLETLKYEINLLVKSIDLPTYSVMSETLNQYNRKKVVQYQQKYNDINVIFHDDNMGLINQLWQAYYNHYYNDPNSASARTAYNRTATRPSSFIKNPYGFKGPVPPFFNYIIIYQMARHEYVSYKLINPVITSWGGGNLGYHLGESHSFETKFAYEAVSYNTGYVDSSEMEGFGAVHYDWMPSPLSSQYPVDISEYPSFPGTNFGSSDLVSKPNTTNTAIKTQSTISTQQTTSSSNIAGISIPVKSNTVTTTATAINTTSTSNTISQSATATPAGYTKGL